MIKNVLIVLVNYKNHADTIECLESLLKLEYTQNQIIVVDNSEDDHSLNNIESWANGKLTFVETKFSDLIYPLSAKPISITVVSEEDFIGNLKTRITIVTSKNRGFAAANNLAVRNCISKPFDFFWLLNNDVVVKPNTLTELVSFSEGKSRLGVLGSKLLYYHNPNNIQAVGGRYFKWVGRVKEVGASEKDCGQWDNRDFKFDYVVGASMFVRKEFLNSVGLMEEDYFLYYEEIDWAIRGRIGNWDQAFCPESVVYHKQGASTGSQKNLPSEISDFYAVRNRILLAKKFFPYTIATLYLSFGLYIFNRLKLKKFDRIKLFFKF